MRQFSLIDVFGWTAIFRHLGAAARGHGHWQTMSVISRSRRLDRWNHRNAEIHVAIQSQMWSLVLICICRMPFLDHRFH